VGRLAAERATFARRAVYSPMLVVLALNVTLSVVQVVLSSQLASAHGVASNEQAPSLQGPRRANMAAVLAPTGRRLLDCAAAGPCGLQREDVLSCLRPALAQIALCVVQAAFALALARGPAACAAARAEITRLQVEVNARVNQCADQVVEFDLGPAFAAVKGEAAVFFPKFRRCMEGLGEASRRADRLQGLEKQAKRLGF